MKIDSLSLDGTEDEHPCDCVRRLLNNQKVCAIVLAFCGILNVLCSTLETIGVISPVLSPYVSTAMGLLCLPAIGACCLLTGRLLKFYRAHANIMSLADFFTMFSNVNLAQRWPNPYLKFLHPFASRLTDITEPKILSLNSSQLSTLANAMKCGNRDFILAALPVLRVCGGEDVLPIIDALAAGKGAAATSLEVRTLATDCRVAITKRVSAEQERSSLLRCTNASAEHAATLLRPSLQEHQSNERLSVAGAGCEQSVERQVSSTQR